MSCTPPAGGPRLESTVGDRTVIQGQVTRGGQPVETAYARLLDHSGEFTAEVVVDDSGEFRFFAAPGEWTVRVLYPGGSGEVQVSANQGTITTADIAV